MARTPTLAEPILKFKAEDRTGKAAAQISKNLRQLEKRAKRAERAAYAMRKRWRSAGRELTRTALGFGAAYVSLGALVRQFSKSTEEFGKFQAGMIGIQKTANLTDGATAQLGARLTELVTEASAIGGALPIARDELLSIAQVAGQLGIKGQGNILKFTEALALLASSSDVVGEEGARDIATLIKVTNASVETSDRLASSLVALGNNTAATESQILGMTTAIATNTAQFGLDVRAQLAWAAVAKESGLEAEATGTAFQRMFGVIQKAALGDGGALAQLSEMLGDTTDNIRALASENPEEVFNRIIAALGQVPNGTAALNALGITSQRATRVFTTMAINADGLNDTLALSRGEWERNTAAIDETKKAAEGHDAQMRILDNRMKAAQTRMGELFGPVEQAAVGQMVVLLEGVANAMEKIFVRDPVKISMQLRARGITSIKEEIAEIDAELATLIMGRGAARRQELMARRERLDAIRKDLNLKALSARARDRFAPPVQAADVAGGDGAFAIPGDIPPVPTGDNDAQGGKSMWQWRMEQEQKLTEAMKEENEKRLAGQKEFARHMAATWGGALEDIVRHGASVSDTLKNMFQNLIWQIIQARIQMAAVGFFTGGGGAIGAGGAGLFGFGGRQAGGAVRAHVPHMVGEAGPELFIPSTPGTIKSAASTMGMMRQPVTINIKNTGGVSTEVEEYVNAAVRVGNEDSVRVIVDELQKPGSSLRRSVRQ